VEKGGLELRKKIVLQGKERTSGKGKEEHSGKKRKGKKLTVEREDGEGWGFCEGKRFIGATLQKKRKSGGKLKKKEKKSQTSLLKNQGYVLSQGPGKAGGR